MIAIQTEHDWIAGLSNCGFAQANIRLIWHRWPFVAYTSFSISSPEQDLKMARSRVEEVWAVIRRAHTCERAWHLVLICSSNWIRSLKGVADISLMSTSVRSPR